MSRHTLGNGQVVTASAGGQQAPIVGIARILINAGIISESQAIHYQTVADGSKITFLESLSQADRKSSRLAAQEIARCFDHPYLDLDAVDLRAFAWDKSFDRAKVEEMRLLPLFQRGHQLFVATADPTRTEGLEYIAHKSGGRRCELVVVDDWQLSAYFSKQGLQFNLDHGSADLMQYASLEDSEATGNSDEDREDSPVVKLVQNVLLTAISQGASDVHFEPYEKFYRIRFRIDGVLKEVIRPPAVLAKKIASRVKVMAALNIAEKRVPQDGKLRQRLGPDRVVDFRVSTLPVVGDNEKIVMRILDASQSKIGIDELGYEASQREHLMHAINRPEGMILVTGPTGSGKTVSMYACLNILNTQERNISTAEDPVEIQLPGVNQVSINPAQGLTYPSALKAFLRQDPDVIMVGEIRDEETASISVKAATTGHLVIATAHTNSATKAISRLVEIGVKPYEIAGSFNLITAQRLLRRLCPHCRKKYSPEPAALKEAGMTDEQVDSMHSTWIPYTAAKGGCRECSGVGYRRRIGVYEVLPISDEMRALISLNADSATLAKQAQKEGIKNLRQSALLKFMHGLTSFEEILVGI